MGGRPWRFRASLVRLKWRQPKKPLCADKPEGCAACKTTWRLWSARCGEGSGGRLGVRLQRPSCSQNAACPPPMSLSFPWACLPQRRKTRPDRC